MKKYLKTILALTVFPQILLVKWLGSFPEFIENYYSMGLYPYLAKGFRFAFGWIPFSIGDLFYTIAGILAIRFLILKGKTLFKKPLFFLREVFVIISLTYFVFHLLWGMNYYRQPIHKKLHISTAYTTADLADFTEKLIAKTNAVHRSITGNDTLPVTLPYGKKDIFNKTPEGFKHLSRNIPGLSYQPVSIKTSLYSLVLTYMGYSGYLNPFTNEAQVNGLIPLFKFPMVSCHEEVHQLGYAAENEANFIGYLAAIHHTDAYFKYSAYSYGLKYCLNALKQKDPKKFKALYPNINTGILKNYIEADNFWRTYQNKAEVVFKHSYDAFLKMNNQAGGIKSYSYMVPLLINYHKEHPL